jgi:tetrahydromethanopterin S-methyltransferase subunit E
MLYALTRPNHDVNLSLIVMNWGLTIEIHKSHSDFNYGASRTGLHDKHWGLVRVKPGGPGAKSKTLVH